MLNFFKNNQKKTFITIILIIIVLAGFYFFRNLSVKAQEQIKIFPASFSGDWQNPEAVFFQDLGEEATWEMFNPQNSALPAEREEETTEQSKVFELTDFSLPQEFTISEIKNIQLRLSLAGQGTADDKLKIDYFYQNSWQSLGELTLENEISNALNGGYFLYALPIFEDWQDLENLKIRFIYSYNPESYILNSKFSAVYLDAAWLEVEYQSIEKPKVEEKITEEQLTEEQPVEEPQKEETEFNWPQKKWKKLFFSEGQPIKSKKSLDWYPDQWQIETDQENKQIDLKISSDQESLIFNGVCQKKYYVILMYAQPTDYEEDPSLFIYNKAFPCQNERYYYELNDLPEQLEDDIYYFLVGEQDETGPWQPITAIQSIRIESKEK